MNYRRIAILDPYANSILTDNDVIDYEVFILGGIVDRESPIHGATSYIASRIPIAEGKRIEFEGSIIGVPFTLNKIVEILLLVRYYGFNIDQAIAGDDLSSKI